MPRTAGPGRPSPVFLRVEENGGKWQVFITRFLWREVGSPARVRFERRGDALAVLPTAENRTGTYAVTAGNSIPRVTMGTPQATALELRRGTFAATVKNGAVVTQFAPAPNQGRRVWLIHQTAGNSPRLVWRIRTSPARSSRVLWEIDGDTERSEAEKEARAFCVGRGYRLVITREHEEVL